jgi:hypothetical protein
MDSTQACNCETVLSYKIVKMVLSYKIFTLKGQCHEIFDSRFFRQSITPRPLINTLKYFWILFRIRRVIYENVLIPHYAT